jgi:hypothetical protein
MMQFRAASQPTQTIAKEHDKHLSPSDQDLPDLVGIGHAFERVNVFEWASQVYLDSKCDVSFTKQLETMIQTIVEIMGIFCKNESSSSMTAPQDDYLDLWLQLVHIESKLAVFKQQITDDTVNNFETAMSFVNIIFPGESRTSDNGSLARFGPKFNQKKKSAIITFDKKNPAYFEIDPRQKDALQRQYNLRLEEWRQLSSRSQNPQPFVKKTVWTLKAKMQALATFLVLLFAALMVANMASNATSWFLHDIHDIKARPRHREPLNPLPSLPLHVPPPPPYPPAPRPATAPTPQQPPPLPPKKPADWQQTPKKNISDAISWTRKAVADTSTAIATTVGMRVLGPHLTHLSILWLNSGVGAVFFATLLTFLNCLLSGDLKTLKQLVSFDFISKMLQSNSNMAGIRLGIFSVVTPAIATFVWKKTTQACEYYSAEHVASVSEEELCEAKYRLDEADLCLNISEISDTHKDTRNKKIQSLLDNFAKKYPGNLIDTHSESWQETCGRLIEAANKYRTQQPDNDARQKAGFAAIKRDLISRNCKDNNEQCRSFYIEHVDACSKRIIAEQNTCIDKVQKMKFSSNAEIKSTHDQETPTVAQLALKLQSSLQAVLGITDKSQALTHGTEGHGVDKTDEDMVRELQSRLHKLVG